MGVLLRYEDTSPALPQISFVLLDYFTYLFLILSTDCLVYLGCKIKDGGLALWSIY